MDIAQAKKQFKDHVLTKVLDTKDVKIFTFGIPDGEKHKWHYFQRWIFDRGTLIIQGDCYCSIYRFDSPKLNIDFFKNVNVGYFSGKCVSDKDGDSQATFEHENALGIIQQHVVDRLVDNFDNEKYETYRLEYVDHVLGWIDMVACSLDNDMGERYKEDILSITEALGDYDGETRLQEIKAGFKDNTAWSCFEEYLLTMYKWDDIGSCEYDDSDVTKFFDLSIKKWKRLSELDFDGKEWKGLGVEDKYTALIPVVMDVLDLTYEFEVDNLLDFDYEGDAHSIMRKEEHEFMFGLDPWEISLTSKTPTPYWHLAALQVAAIKYPNP